MKTKKQLKKNLSNKKRNKEKLLITNDKGYAYYRFSYEKKRYKISLGKYGSPESETNYYIFRAEFAQNPIAAIEKWSSRRNKPTTTPTEQSITIETLVKEFLDKMEQIEIQNNKGKKYTQDFGHYKCAGQLLIDVLGEHFPANNIRKINLKKVRNYFNDLPSQKDGRLPSRQYVNKVIGYAKRILTWGVDEKDLDEILLSASKAVKPLKDGAGNRETECRKDVPDEVVEKTVPHLTPSLKAMVLVQRTTGCRPVEVCRMKVGNLDYSRFEKGIVVCVLKQHKTARYGKLKAIIIKVDEEFQYMLPYLKGKQPDDYIFTPQQHLKELRAKRASKNPTKSQLRRNAANAKNPKKKLNEYWTQPNYGRAIKNAIKTANKKLPPNDQIPLWTSYQARHANATEVIQKTKNIDIARACMGHTSTKTTEIYNHTDADANIDYRMKNKSSLIETIKKMDMEEPETVKTKKQDMVKTEKSESIEPTD